MLTTLLSKLRAFAIKINKVCDNFLFQVYTHTHTNTNTPTHVLGNYVHVKLYRCLMASLGLETQHS